MQDSDHLKIRAVSLILREFVQQERKKGLEIKKVLCVHPKQAKGLKAWAGDGLEYKY